MAAIGQVDQRILKKSLPMLDRDLFGDSDDEMEEKKVVKKSYPMLFDSDDEGRVKANVVKAKVVKTQKFDKELFAAKYEACLYKRLNDRYKQHNRILNDESQKWRDESQKWHGDCCEYERTLSDLISKSTSEIEARDRKLRAIAAEKRIADTKIRDLEARLRDTTSVLNDFRTQDTIVIYNRGRTDGMTDIKEKIRRLSHSIHVGGGGRRTVFEMGDFIAL